MSNGPPTTRIHLTTLPPLLQLALAAGLGILLDRAGKDWLDARGLAMWWTIAVACLLVSLCLRPRCPRHWVTSLLLLAVVSVGGSWHHLRWHYFEENQLARFATDVSEPVCLEAVVLDRQKYQPAPPPNPLRALPVGEISEIQIRVARIRDGQAWRSAEGICRMRVKGSLPGVNTGDELQVFASMSRIAPALNPGEYDWARVGRGAGRYCEIFCRSPACVTVTTAANNFSPHQWLDKIGQSCEMHLSQYIRPAQNNLAQAILLGARERLEDNVRSAFLRTGTIHLLVVSGLHVGLLAAAIWVIVCSGILPRRTGIILTGVLVVGYALVVGGRPPVMRASVLVVLTLFAIAKGRRISGANLLAAASLVVLAYNPNELFRSGTQLSFLCVAALMAYGNAWQIRKPIDPLTRLIRDTRPGYQKALRWLGENFKQTTLASLAVWLVVAPLVAYHFHITAPISILIAPLVWPLVGIALITGLAICGFAWLLPPLAWLLGEVCSVCLWGTESIVALASRTDIGSYYLPGPPGWWLTIFYAGLLAAASLLWPRVRLTHLAICATLWLAFGLAVSGMNARVSNHEEKFRCTFLAVGHGTCVVLELPSGETLLYDAGSLNSPERASQTIASFLWSRGITHLDAVVLSHADVDHYNAMPGLLERFDVAKVYVSPLMFDPWINDGFLDAPEHLRQTLVDANVPLEEIWINDRLTAASEKVLIEVLHPPRRGVAGKDNANSLLLAIHYAGQSILLPGDLESPGIEAVTAERPQHFDIVMAPHHGSARSDPPGFAAWCTPDYVVVSGPRVGPRQQFTADSYQQVGAKVLHTANVGAVEFVIDGSGVACLQFMPER